MTTRLLPVIEWSRLADTDLAGAWVHLDPTTARVIVVEQDGAIIGHLAVLPLWHAEGLWVAPAHQKRGRVLRLLLQGLGRTVADLGITTVLPGSASDEMDAILARLGAAPLPATIYTLNVQECRPCRPSS